MSSIIVLDSSEDEADPVKKPKTPAKSPAQPSPVSSPILPLRSIPSPVIQSTSILLSDKTPSPKEIISLESDGTPPDEKKRKSDEIADKPRKRIKPTLLSATIDREKFNADSPTISFENDDEIFPAPENLNDRNHAVKNEGSNEDETEKRSTDSPEDQPQQQQSVENPEDENSSKDEIDENPITTSFKALLDACRKADPSDDMNTLIEKKLLKYYHSVHPDFVTSKGFCRTVKTVCDQIEASPELVYYQLKTVVEELKIRRKSKAAVMSNEDVSSTGNARRDHQIRTLSKGLLNLTRRIEKLEEADVDLGDEENSAYLLLERLKKHACKIYDKICDLTGESKHAHRQVKKPVTFQGTAYPQFNRTLQAFVNRTHTFPDFFDVLRCLEHCNAQYGLGLRNDDMRKIAQDAFLKIGKLLQNRRKADLYETVAHFTGTAPDPALGDESLSEKLTENQKYHAKIGSIIDRFAKEQEIAAAELKENKTKLKGEQIINEQSQQPDGDSVQETDSHVTSNGKVNSVCDNIEENKSNPATPKDDSNSDKENQSNVESKEIESAKTSDTNKNVVPVEEIVISDEDDS